MSVDKLWTEFSVRMHTETAQSGGAVDIEGIQTVELAPGLRTAIERSDGNVFPAFGSLVGGAPTARFTTSDLAALIDECGLTGMLVDSGTNPGIELYFQRMAFGGTRDAFGSATHFKATIPNGLLVLRSLELNHGEMAALSAELFAVQQGATAPLTLDEASARPNINPAGDVKWTLGKVDLNGTDFDALSSVSIDFGVDVLAESRDSDIYPSFPTIREIRPTITLRGSHIDLTSVLTEDGTFYSASQVIVYARKRSEGGTFVADATPEHISFSLGKCRVDWDTIGSDPKELSVTIRPWDTPGGVAPITIDTTAAIV